MYATPTDFDLWFVAKLASGLGRHPLFDWTIQSLISHAVLGGLWFAAALFIFWVLGARQGQELVQRQVLTTLLGTALAIALSYIGARLVHWPPPSSYPGLRDLCPDYIERNLNPNSFPSISTAVYSAVAAGVFRLRRWAGVLLGFAVLVAVSIPRIYVLGHYPSDIGGGLLAGLGGALLALALERWMVRPVLPIFRSERLAWLGHFVVFVWILQIALEFRDAAWLARGLKVLFK